MSSERSLQIPEHHQVYEREFDLDLSSVLYGDSKL